jgi:uncharacterized protein YndB with AHSA1/START domain
MADKMEIRNEIFINAAKDKVWDMLTNPEQTKKYMHGCGAISNWKVGDPLVWNSVWEGKEMTFVKGEIKDIKPASYLAYTTIDPNNPNMPDIPSNYLTVTYSLTEKDGGTQLEVTQGGYETAALGEKRYNEAKEGGGWSSILEQIKTLAEAE